MGVGALIDYRISLYGFPMRWRTRIAQYTPGVDFVDLQLKGPYKYWHHLHSFTATKSGTQLNDQVTYELPGGVLGEMVHALMVRKQLRTIFDYRAKVVEARFGSAKTTAAEAKV